MITATDVELRAGARVLLDAASFRVAPGDRIGLVGRNGAGKTTLTKVLAGESQPAAGTITRSGEVGYLPQDPRTGDLDVTRPRPHPVRPRPGRRPARAARDRGARWPARTDDDPRQGDAPLRPARGRVHRQRRLRRRVRGRHASPPASGLPDRVLAQPLRHPVRRSAPPGRAGPDPVLRRRDAAARRADQPPRRRLDRLAARLPQGLPGRPHRHQPRRRPARRRASTRSSTWTPTAPTLDVYNVGWKTYLQQRETDERRRKRERANAEKKAAALHAAGRQDARQGHQGRRRAEHGASAPSGCSPAWRRCGVSDKVAKLRFPTRRRAARPR